MEGLQGQVWTSLFSPWTQSRLDCKFTCKLAAYLCFVFRQSSQGFLKAGGFRGIYKGLSAAAVGSAPGAALFFSTYETTKSVINSNNAQQRIAEPVVHMMAACCGEVVRNHIASLNPFLCYADGLSSTSTH